jgi:hypothetical protein
MRAWNIFGWTDFKGRTRAYWNTVVLQRALSS